MQNPIMNRYGKEYKNIYISLDTAESLCCTWESNTQRYKSTIPFQVPMWNHVARQCYLKEWLESTSSTERPPIHFMGTAQLSVYAEEAEVECFYEDLQDLLELIPKKRCPFHYKGLECKSRKSRNTWSNRQIWPWSTEWSRAKANRVLPRERTGHSKHPLRTTQEKTLHMDITRWSTLKSDWLYSLKPEMEKLYTVSKNRTRRRLWLRLWTPDCSIFRLK